MLDLTGLPAAYEVGGWAAGMVTGGRGNDTVRNPELASVLVCDPQLDPRPASVVISPNGTMTVETGTEVPTPISGNVPLDQARIVTSQSLAYAIAEPGPESKGLSRMANNLFFAGDVDMANNWGSTTVQPLPLDVLSLKMDAYVRSAAKGYMDGSQAGGPPSTITIKDALRQVPRTAITTNGPFFIVTVLLILAAAGLIMESSLDSRNRRDPFTLWAVLWALEQSAGQAESAGP